MRTTYSIYCQIISKRVEKSKNVESEKKSEVFQKKSDSLLDRIENRSHTHHTHFCIKNNKYNDKNNHSLRSHAFIRGVDVFDEDFRVGTRERDPSRAERDVDEQIGEYP